MRDIIKYSSIVALGYIPLGIAFGILCDNAGISVIYAIIMSIFVFAGSAQFLAITLITNHASIPAVFFFTLLLNSRHFFYSAYTYNVYKNIPIVKRLYLMFALTDETFSIISTLPKEEAEDTRLLLGLSALNHFWWVLGSALGAVLGSIIAIKIEGLDFALVALFTILLVEQFYKSNKIFAVGIAIIAAALSFIFFHGNNFLLSSIGIALTLFILGQTINAKLIRT